LNYDDIIEIKLRRRGSGIKGLLIGHVPCLFLGVFTIKDDFFNRITQGVLVYYSVLGIGAITGFSHPNKFVVKNDTTSKLLLKKELSKFS
jgi:hypothetical protein